MPIFSNVTTNFSIAGTDIGARFVQKDYLMDVYPSLIGTFKQAGLWTYGTNLAGVLGNNSQSSSLSSPVQTVSGGTNWIKITAGTFQTAAGIKTDGTLWTWGNNLFGGLGDNTTISRSSPVQTVAGGTNWSHVSCLGYCTLAIKTDNTLWCWGVNQSGELGDNTLISRSSPVQTVAGGTNWSQVSGTSAIKLDGTLWLWGSNFYATVGDGTGGGFGAARSSPVQTVAGGTNWKSVSYSRNGHVGAIKSDGTLWMWGNNINGECGNNTNNIFSSGGVTSPVQTSTGGTNWKQVSCGQNFTAAIKTDGTLWTWGWNRWYQAGGGDNPGRGTKSSNPTQTVPGADWKQVSVGNVSVGAVKTNGTLWVWGRELNNTFSAFDDSGFFTAQSTPVQTVAGGSNWKTVSVGDQNLVTIRDDSADIFGDPL